MKIRNLTGHNINIVSENKIIEADGLIRASIKIEEKKVEGLDFPIVKRIVKGLEGDIDLLQDADAVIVSAQMISIIKDRYPNLTVLTVGETVRERQSDGSVIIRGAKNLVLN